MPRSERKPNTVMPTASTLRKTDRVSRPLLYSAGAGAGANRAIDPGLKTELTFCVPDKTRSTHRNTATAMASPTPRARPKRHRGTKRSKARDVALRVRDARAASGKPVFTLRSPAVRYASRRKAQSLQPMLQCTNVAASLISFTGLGTRTFLGIARARTPQEEASRRSRARASS